MGAVQALPVAPPLQEDPAGCGSQPRSSHLAPSPRTHRLAQALFQFLPFWLLSGASPQIFCFIPRCSGQAVKQALSPLHGTKQPRGRHQTPEGSPLAAAGATAQDSGPAAQQPPQNRSQHKGSVWEDSGLHIWGPSSCQAPRPCSLPAASFQPAPAAATFSLP